MTAKQIAQLLADRQKGGIFTIKSRRPCRVKKDSPFIEKESVYQGMKCEYSSRKNVREAMAENRRAEPELPKGIKRCFYENGVKFYESFGGNVSVAVPITGNKPQSQFYLDGKPVSKSDVEVYLLASEKPKPRPKEELRELGQENFVRISVDNVLEVS